MIIKLFTLLKGYNHKYRVDIACEQSLKSLPPCCHVAGLSRYSSTPPLANMRFTNGIHISDITFNSKSCKQLTFCGQLG